MFQDEGGELGGFTATCFAAEDEDLVFFEGVDDLFAEGGDGEGGTLMLSSSSSYTSAFPCLCYTQTKRCRLQAYVDKQANWPA